MDEIQHAHDEVFYSLFDSERTGHVTFEKFRSTIKFLGVDLDHEAINWLISELDHAGEGMIDMKYLCKYTREISRLRFDHHQKKGLKSLFNFCSKSH
jgi:Ca2+-binding EF-hand superfamily protein